MSKSFDTFRYESVELLLQRPSFRNYEIEREISRGGMGVIYLARQRDLGREVALKLMLQRNPSSQDIARFRREALALAQLKHRHIVRLYDFGIESSIPYVIMEFIEGRTLSEIVQESHRFTGEGPELERCLGWMRSICDALSYCHDEGVVHRDIKPENILIETETDRAVLLDFGLVKQGFDTISEDASGFTQNLSQSGAIYGTPAYMSPEQLDSGEFGAVGRKSDVWSLGATLFFCLTGETPHPDLGFTELITWRVRNQARRARAVNKTVPKWLDRLCARALVKDQGKRLSVEEFSALLEEPEAEEGSRTILVLGVVLVMLLTLGAMLFVYLGYEREIAKLKEDIVARPEGKDKDEPKLEVRPDTPPAATRQDLGSLAKWSSLKEVDQDEQVLAVVKSLEGFRYLGLKEFRCGGFGTRVGQFQHLPTGMIMHLIPGGRFPMEINGTMVEARVAPMLVSQDEVTQEQWDKGKVKPTDSRRTRDPALPMTGISWNSAKAWGEAYGFRIPTEAEWMWAYRGGNGSQYFWGERPDHRYFWTRSNAKDARKAQEHVGFENAFGLRDMAGNLSEFVADPITVALPEGHIHKTWPFRMIRGGSFRHGVERATVMSRTPIIQQGRSSSVGVRYVRSVPGFPVNEEVDYGRHFDLSKISAPATISLLYDRDRWSRAAKGTQNTIMKQAAALLGPKFKMLGVKTAICGSVQFRVGSFLHIPSDIKFRLIPGGHFVMGEKRFGWTSPETRVQVKPFLISYYPVTQEQFDRFASVDKREQKDPLFPIHNLSYLDAKRWLAKVGDGLRLPSEAEWEYAARGGTRGRYFWGDGYNPKFCHVRTHKNPVLHRVTEHRSAWNAFGLSDVLGHVWELCEDSWVPNLENLPTDGRPRISRNTTKHVLRGHSTWDKKEKLHIATRRPIEADARARSVGFRVCVSIPKLGRKR